MVEHTTIRRKYSFIVGLLILGITPVLIWTGFKDRQSFDKGCENYADPLRVEIHDTRFNLPAAYEPVFNSKLNALGMPEVEAPRPAKFKTQDGTKFNKGYCQKENSPEVKVWGFSLTTNDLDASKKPAMKSYDDTSDVYGFSSDYIPNVLPMYGHPRLNYCEVFTSSLFSVGKRSIFSENPLFFELKSDTKSYYISDQVTLFGNPVVIACNQDRSCNLMAPINNDAEAEINFTLDKVKPEKWPDFILKYQEFLKSLMPDNNGLKVYPDCKYLFEDAKHTEKLSIKTKNNN